MRRVVWARAVPAHRGTRPELTPARSSVPRLLAALLLLGGVLTSCGFLPISGRRTSTPRYASRPDGARGFRRRMLTRVARSDYAHGRSENRVDEGACFLEAGDRRAEYGAGNVHAEPTPHITCHPQYAGTTGQKPASRDAGCVAGGEPRSQAVVKVKIIPNVPLAACHPAPIMPGPH